MRERFRQELLMRCRVIQAYADSGVVGLEEQRDHHATIFSIGQRLVAAHVRPLTIGRHLVASVTGCNPRQVSKWRATLCGQKFYPDPETVAGQRISHQQLTQQQQYNKGNGHVDLG